MPWIVASPSPVPWPLGLVVKNGSEARAATSGGMPVPVSLTRRRTYRRGARPGFVLAYARSTSTFSVSSVSVPPSGIASRALTARLSRTCSSCP